MSIDIWWNNEIYNWNLLFAFFFPSREQRTRPMNETIMIFPWMIMMKRMGVERCENSTNANLILLSGNPIVYCLKHNSIKRHDTSEKDDNRHFNAERKGYEMEWEKKNNVCASCEYNSYIYALVVRLFNGMHSGMRIFGLGFSDFMCIKAIGLCVCVFFFLGHIIFSYIENWLHLNDCCLHKELTLRHTQTLDKGG